MTRLADGEAGLPAGQDSSRHWERIIYCPELAADQIRIARCQQQVLARMQRFRRERLRQAVTELFAVHEELEIAAAAEVDARAVLYSVGFWRELMAESYSREELLLVIDLLFKLLNGWEEEELPQLAAATARLSPEQYYASLGPAFAGCTEHVVKFLRGAHRLGVPSALRVVEAMLEAKGKDPDWWLMTINPLFEEALEYLRTGEPGQNFHVDAERRVRAGLSALVSRRQFMREYYDRLLARFEAVHRHLWEPVTDLMTAPVAAADLMHRGLLLASLNLLLAVLQIPELKPLLTRDWFPGSEWKNGVACPRLHAFLLDQVLEDNAPDAATGPRACLLRELIMNPKHFRRTHVPPAWGKTKSRLGKFAGDLARRCPPAARERFRQQTAGDADYPTVLQAAGEAFHEALTVVDREKPEELLTFIVTNVAPAAPRLMAALIDRFEHGWFEANPPPLPAAEPPLPAVPIAAEAARIEADAAAAAVEEELDAIARETEAREVFVVAYLVDPARPKATSPVRVASAQDLVQPLETWLREAGMDSTIKSASLAGAVLYYARMPEPERMLWPMKENIQGRHYDKIKRGKMRLLLTRSDEQILVHIYQRRDWQHPEHERK